MIQAGFQGKKMTVVIKIKEKRGVGQYTIHGTENTFRTVGGVNEVGDKHGFSEEDIRQAIRTLFCETLIDEYKDNYAIIGFDTKRNALEILYNLINDETMEVYHAMKCSKSFHRKYGPKGEDHA
jgi:hypothetical protein